MRRRPNLNKLNPFDAADMRIIDAEWRRRKRRDTARGWVRVAACISAYLVIAVLVILICYVVGALILGLGSFAITPER